MGKEGKGGNRFHMGWQADVGCTGDAESASNDACMQKRGEGGRKKVMPTCGPHEPVRERDEGGHTVIPIFILF